jgi:hypothetical protein
MTYRPKPLSEQPEPATIELAHHAASGHLALFVGAGVSRSAPSSIPTAPELVVLLHPRLVGEFGIAGMIDGQPKELQVVGDEADAKSLKDALKLMIAGLPEFVTDPNFGHLAIAALLREGAAQLLCVNWDQCVENACTELGFYLAPTITDADRVGRLGLASYHKLNGCLSQPLTLMVTSAEVDQPLPWAHAEVQAALGGKVVAFLGLGTIPDYLRHRLGELIERLPDVSAVRVVSLSISEAWRVILGAALEQAAVARSADDYLDDVLRAFVRMHLANAEARAAALAESGNAPREISRGIASLTSALFTTDALTAWRWLTRGARAVPIGNPVLGSEPGLRALLAAALLIREAAIETSATGDGFAVKAGRYYVEVCIAPGVPSSDATERQEARVEKRRAQGGYPDLRVPVVHLCVGQYGRLPMKQTLPNVGWEEDPEDLVEGPTSGRHWWVDANDLMGGEVWDLSA